MTVLKYLGRVMTTGDQDWPVVIGILQKARKSWGRMSRVLSQEGEDPKVLDHFFNVLVQKVLLFRAKMWVLNPRMERALSSFQRSVA